MTRVLLFFLTVASFSHVSLWTSEGLSGTPVCFLRICSFVIIFLRVYWGPHGTRTCGSHDRPGTRRAFCLPNAKTLNNKWVANSKMTSLVFFLFRSQEIWSLWDNSGALNWKTCMCLLLSLSMSILCTSFRMSRYFAVNSWLSNWNLAPNLSDFAAPLE